MTRMAGGPADTRILGFDAGILFCLGACKEFKLSFQHGQWVASFPLGRKRSSERRGASWCRLPFLVPRSAGPCPEDVETFEFDDV